MLEHWSFDPVLLLLGAAAAVHGIGLRRRLRGLRATRRGSSPSGRHLANEWVLRGAAFYGGLLLTAVAICSPLDYWADDYLFAHMIQHIVLAFFAPALIVLGAPWLVLQRGLPGWLRRAVGHLLQRLRRSASLRLAARLLGDPWTAVIAFNVDMVVWHLPGPMDLAERNSTVHIWAEHLGFLVLGVLLFLHFLDSPPWRSRLVPVERVAAAFATNAVMVGIAMTLVLFSHRAYPVYAHTPHALFGQFADQQVAGGALWICGEFTLAPVIYWNVQVLLRGQCGPRRARDLLAPWTRRAGRWAAVSPAQAEMGWRQQSALLRALPGFAPATTRHAAHQAPDDDAAPP